MSQTYATYEGNEPYIFVSYAHKDEKIVLPIIRALQEAGFRVWYDAGIEAGTEWPPSISRHLKASHCLISFMSPRAADSRYCRKEIIIAQSQEPPIPMLCVYLEDFPLPDGLDMQLCDIQAMFWYRHRNNESFMQELIKAKILQECRVESVEAVSPNVSSVTSPEESSSASATAQPENIHDNMADLIDTITSSFFVGNKNMSGVSLSQVLQQRTSKRTSSGTKDSADDIDDVISMLKKPSGSGGGRNGNPPRRY